MNILLGVTGSAAAYKAAAIASTLTKEGDSVYTIMTRNATRFITPLTFQTLTSNTAYIETFDQFQSVPVHLKLADSADILAIAPATADSIAKLAAGICDDLLTTVALTVTCPILIAPAMESRMYSNPATAENIATLKERGVYFIGPESGRLASGKTGPGRMSEPEKIIKEIRTVLNSASLHRDTEKE